MSSPTLGYDGGMALPGHVVTPETRAKISAALTGRTYTDAERESHGRVDNSGELSATWRGEDVSYNGAHNRARKALPLVCAHADTTCCGQLEVALRRDAPADMVRISPRGHAYFFGATSSEGYLRLSRSHHRRYDETPLPWS